METIATYKDGTIIRYPFDHPDYFYNGGIDTKEVIKFAVMDNGFLFCGVDILERFFVFAERVVHTDLPKGDYQLISFKRVSIVSDGTENIRYCMGLHGDIDGVNHKRVVFFTPSGDYQFALTT